MASQLSVDFRDSNFAKQLCLNSVQFSFIPKIFHKVSDTRLQMDYGMFIKVIFCSMFQSGHLDQSTIRANYFETISSIGQWWSLLTKVLMPPGAKLSLLLSFQNLLKIRFFLDMSDACQHCRGFTRDLLCWSLDSGSREVLIRIQAENILIFSWVFWLLLSSSLEA